MAAGSAAAAGPRSAKKLAALGRRLNVVVILSDDERLDGDTVMRNVQHLLAGHGVTFSNYHVTTSECGPSRASILLGQYSHHTGVLDNFGPHSFPAFDQNSNLAVWLHSSGYRTALVGKYLNDYTLYGHNEIPPGWDDFQAMDSVPMEEYYDYTVNDNGRLEHYGTAAKDYSTTVLTNKAVDFLRQRTARSSSTSRRSRRTCRRSRRSRTRTGSSISRRSTRRRSTRRTSATSPGAPGTPTC